MIQGAPLESHVSNTTLHGTSYRAVLVWGHNLAMGRNSVVLWSVRTDVQCQWCRGTKKKFCRACTWKLEVLRKGFWNMAVALTGGNCHMSPVMMRFKPPKGRAMPLAFNFQVPLARVAWVSRFSKVANTSKPVVEHSSSTIQRRRWYCTNCSGPCVVVLLVCFELMRMLAKECKVIPAIKAAWVFWGARKTNSCGWVHSQMVSKKWRSQFKVCVFPAPGTPWQMVLNGSLREGVSVTSSWPSAKQRWMTARRKLLCSSVGLTCLSCSQRDCNHSVAFWFVKVP